MIYKIPDIIFDFIRNYLSNDDYHSLLNTSKKLFAEMKRKTIYFHLNQEKSLQYLEDKEFQSLLLSKVENGWNQIRVIYNDSIELPSEFPPIHRFDASIYVLPDYVMNTFQSLSCTLSEHAMQLPLLTNVKELELYFEFTYRTFDLRGLSHLKKLILHHVGDMDITPLQHIPDLTLSSDSQDDYNESRDFSMFTSQKRLDLWDCHNLTNVNSFRFIRILSLSRCHHLQDLCPLNGIYDLTLNSCNISDLSGLGNHHRFSLYYSRDNTIGYESLLYIPKVYLYSSNIEDLQVLRYAKVVFLHQCRKVCDVSPLRRVKKIDIDACSNLINLETLSDVPDLSLSFHQYLNEVNDQLLASLQNRRLQLIANQWKISSFFALSTHIQELSIGGSDTIAQLIYEGKGTNFFKSLISLTLTDISKLNSLDVDGFADIPSITICQCENLVSLNGLGRNRSVEADRCLKLEDVSSIAFVPIVTLRGCSQIRNIDTKIYSIASSHFSLHR